MVPKPYRRRRVKLRLRRYLPELPKLPAISQEAALALQGCIHCISQSEYKIEIMLLLLVLVMCYLILHGIWKLWTILSGNPTFRYILIVCATIGVLLLMVTYENELRNVNYFLYCNTYSTMSRMQHVVQNLANQAYTCLTFLVYNPFIVKLSEIPWQVLNYGLNCASNIGCWFYVNVLRLLLLLHDNIPGGIPGIVLSFFVIMQQQRYRQLSKTHDRCVADLLALEDIKSKLQLELVNNKSRLQLEIEDIQSQLHTANQKLKQKSEEIRKLSSSLEEERDKRLCGICQDQIKTILLLPCNHLCLCKQCLDHKEWKNCPICRNCVQSTVMVYV